MHTKEGELNFVNMIGLIIWGATHECIDSLLRFDQKSYFSITPRGKASMEAGYLFHKILFGSHDLAIWRTDSLDVFP